MPIRHHRVMAWRPEAGFAAGKSRCRGLTRAMKGYFPGILSLLILLSSCGTTVDAHRFRVYSGERLTSHNSAIVDCSDPDLVVRSVDDNVLSGLASDLSGISGRRAFEVLPGDHAFIIQYRDRNVGDYEPVRYSEKMVVSFHAEPRHVYALEAAFTRFYVPHVVDITDEVMSGGNKRLNWFRMWLEDRVKKDCYFHCVDKVR